MSEWKQYIEEMVAAPVSKLVLSHPKNKSEAYKKSASAEKKTTIRWKSIPRSRYSMKTCSRSSS